MAFLEQSVGKMRAGLDRVAKRIVIAIGERLVLSSPVGDPRKWAVHVAPKGYRGGHFRMNWQYGYGIEPEGEVAGVDPSGRLSLDKIRGDVKNSPAAGIHNIVNNVDYAIAIENGHSRFQAPTGVVKLTVLEFPGIVRRAQE